MIDAQRFIARNKRIAEQIAAAMIKHAMKSMSDEEFVAYATGVEYILRIIVQRPELAEPLLDSLLEIKHNVVGADVDDEMPLMIRELLQAADDHVDGKHDHDED